MTVKQLREALEGQPEDRKVILSADEEGNSYSELYEVFVSAALPLDPNEEINTIHPEDLKTYQAEAAEWGDEFEYEEVIVLW